MNCLDCEKELDEQHIWPGYCVTCFIGYQEKLQEWVQDNLSVNRDAAGIMIAVAGKTAAIIDNDNEAFNMMTYLRWFLENYRAIWESSSINITYKGEDFDLDEIVIGSGQLPDTSKAAFSKLDDEPEDYEGSMYG